IQANLAGEGNIFDHATTVPMSLMEAAILQSVRVEVPPVEQPAYSPLLPRLAELAPAGVQLGVHTQQFVPANGEQSDMHEILLAQAAG
ncbi:hypothetical protein RA274_28025, partial [Pseudomonas syringae pv. tagetis]|uniref:hypothetical protein n=1 Tax=Pseudomonas syringae group genomosp. 7 TaxID=251699 RepID=UPI00376F8FAD